MAALITHKNGVGRRVEIISAHDLRQMFHNDEAGKVNDQLGVDVRQPLTHIPTLTAQEQADVAALGHNKLLNYVVARAFGGIHAALNPLRPKSNPELLAILQSAQP